MKLSVPVEFNFSCSIPVRITDLNYGGHVGNDTVLSIIHEARMQFLRSYGLTEMEFGGVGMIMANVNIDFRSELFYGDIVIASVAIGLFTKIGFTIYYKLEKKDGGRMKTVANANTGMICYDYGRKKIASVPGEVISILTDN